MRLVYTHHTIVTLMAIAIFTTIVGGFFYKDKTPGITRGYSGLSRGIRGKETSHPVRMAFL